MEWVREDARDNRRNKHAAETMKQRGMAGASFTRNAKSNETPFVRPLKKGFGTKFRCENGQKTA